MISSLDNKKVKDWTRLHLKKYRSNEYLLLDPKLVEAAKEKAYLKTLIYCGNPPFEFANSFEVSKEVLLKITKGLDLPYIGIGLPLIMSNNSGSRVMLLDELADPLNIGRIMESAYLFGFDTIVLSENCADIYHEKCLKACKGTIYKLNIRKGDLETEIAALHRQGYLIYATGLKANTLELYDVPVADKMAFVLGNEGSGVREKIFAVADGVVKIDMHNIDSLNVAMAGSIVMYRFGERNAEN